MPRLTQAAYQGVKAQVDALNRRYGGRRGRNLRNRLKNLDAQLVEFNKQ